MGRSRTASRKALIHNLSPVVASVALDPEDAAQILVRLLATERETQVSAVIDGRITRCLEHRDYYQRLRDQLAERLLRATLSLVNLVDPLDFHHKVGVDPLPEITPMALFPHRSERWR